MAASYRLLTDHYLPGGFVQAGTTVTEGDGNIPVGWIPSLAVDPLNTLAIQNFWNQGPQGMDDAEITRDFYPLFWQRWTNQPVTAPAVYWKQTARGVFQLTGAGASLGVKTVFVTGVVGALIRPALQFEFGRNSMYLGGPS